MEKLRPLVSFFVPGKCFDSLLLDLNFNDADCIKLAVSKCLGYGMILGGSMVKLPQILKICSAKSAAGLSIPSVIMDLAGVTASTAYSYNQQYPFSAYGEGVFLMFETALILMLALHYGRQTLQAGSFAMVYTVLLILIANNAISDNALLWGQILAPPLAIIGKFIQAYDNLKAGHTGHLSLITMSLLFLGCVARIFTSITETGDSIVIILFVAATFANLVLVLQIFYYWNATIKALKASEGKKNE